jgi:23S rRNA pseudouridine2605 synthase
MSEGRNRQIRRTFLSLGYEVKRLHRTDFGNYSLGDMKPGEHALTDIR